MLISHALGDGKSIDPDLVRGTGNHVREAGGFSMSGSLHAPISSHL